MEEPAERIPGLQIDNDKVSTLDEIVSTYGRYKMARHTRSGLDEFVSSSSRSPTCEEDVESVAYEQLLEDGEMSEGSLPLVDVSAVNTEARAEAAANALLLRRSNKLELSAGKLNRVQWIKHNCNAGFLL